MDGAAKDERPEVGRLIAAMAVLALTVHVAVNRAGGYGYSRDELPTGSRRDRRS